MRAWIAIDRGETTRAEAILADGPANQPSIARLRAELAMVHDDPAAALPYLRIAEKDDPTDRRTLFSMSRALTLLDRPDEAAPYLDAVRRHDGLHQLASKAAALPELNDASLCFEIGESCLALGRPLEARAWFNASTSIDPLHSSAQAALGKLDREVQGVAPSPLNPGIGLDETSEKR